MSPFVARAIRNAVACPHCGAAQRRRCRTPTGRPVPEHLARVYADLFKKPLPTPNHR